MTKLFKPTLVIIMVLILTQDIHSALFDNEIWSFDLGEEIVRVHAYNYSDGVIRILASAGEHDVGNRRAYLIEDQEVVWTSEEFSYLSTGQLVDFYNNGQLSILISGYTDGGYMLYCFSGDEYNIEEEFTIGNMIHGGERPGKNIGCISKVYNGESDSSRTLFIGLYDTRAWFSPGFSIGSEGNGYVVRYSLTNEEYIGDDIESGVIRNWYMTDYDFDGTKEFLALGHYEYYSEDLSGHGSDRDEWRNYISASNRDELELQQEFEDDGYRYRFFSFDTTNGNFTLYFHHERDEDNQDLIAYDFQNNEIIDEYELDLNENENITYSRMLHLDRNGFDQAILLCTYDFDQGITQFKLFGGERFSEELASDSLGEFSRFLDLVEFADFDDDNIDELIVERDNIITIYDIDFLTDVSSRPIGNIPTAYSMTSYPNPFNSSTAIKYQLPRSTHVTVRIFDTNGRVVGNLVNDQAQAGNHEITWDAIDQPTGMYFALLNAGGVTRMKKLVIIK